MTVNKLHDCDLPTADENTGAPQCSVDNALALFVGKWKLPILHNLYKKTLRFSELQKLLPEVTQKMLTQQLRELETDGMVTRKVYAEVPSKVEYTSTLIAKKLEPVLKVLCSWGQEHRDVQKEDVAAKDPADSKE